MINSRRYALGAIAMVAMLAGCGGSQIAPTGGAMISGASASHGQSWMKPGSSSGDLLYISNSAGVSVFTYPGAQLVGTLTGLQDPQAICSDTNGNVWITNGYASDGGAGYLFEYAHGGTKPIRTLYDTEGIPHGCSWDPTTGNLAVPNGKPSVAIYRQARGTPTYYSTEDFIANPLCIGYDGSGNVYFSGTGSGSHHPAYIPKGKSSVMKFGWIPTPNPHGCFQWDGKDLAVAHGNEFWRYKIRGHSSTRVGQVNFSEGFVDSGFWIQGSVVIVSSYDAGLVYFFNYPAGGSPINTITGLDYPRGVAVSVAPSGNRIHR